MANLPVDRNKDYMYQMWGTTKLVTDYESIQEKRVLQEIVNDDIGKRHHLKEQTMIHEQIRNDEDYDDWEYGTEPSYGKPQ